MGSLPTYCSSVALPTSKVPSGSLVMTYLWVPSVTSQSAGLFEESSRIRVTVGLAPSVIETGEAVGVAGGVLNQVTHWAGSGMVAFRFVPRSLALGAGVGADGHGEECGKAAGPHGVPRAFWMKTGSPRR